MERGRKGGGRKERDEVSRQGGKLNVTSHI